jgi:amidohydrolase
MKDKIYQEIDNLKEELLNLSKKIHENPELCFEEYKSSKFIKELLRKHDFEIEENSGGIETAFKARFKGKIKGPTVAFLAEYDALPEIGHGCGHNLIATASVGAALGLSKLMKDLPGEIVLMGTPAEEGGGGKILLLEEGEFDDIDFALMAHPSTQALIGRGGLATTGVDLKYRGVSAHSAAPEDGINALQAVIQTFNLIDSIRAQLPFKTNINGIITKGGTASNIIPDFASCDFSVRTRTFDDLKTVVAKIKNTVEAVEKLTGAKAEVTIEKAYAERYPNLTIGEVYKKYMEDQREEVDYPDPYAKIGSSDIGNVTLKIPAIHAYFKITEKDIASHSTNFTEAALTDEAHESTFKTSKALSCTGYEILTDTKLREQILKEYSEKVPKYDNFDLE